MKAHASKVYLHHWARTTAAAQPTRLLSEDSRNPAADLQHLSCQSFVLGVSFGRGTAVSINILIVSNDLLMNYLKTLCYKRSLIYKIEGRVHSTRAGTY